MTRITFECITQATDFDPDTRTTTTPGMWETGWESVPRVGDWVDIPGRDEMRKVKHVWWDESGGAHIRLGDVS